MKKALIGKKVGMTQIFDENGTVIPVTVLEAGPCVVAQVKTIENDGYEAVQLGFGEVKENKLNKPEKGHFAKANVTAKKHLREFRLDSIEGIKVGDELKEKSDKPINYTGIAIKGLLFHFKPVKAKVIVDGVTEEFTKVWLTPTMKGRFYGGGMMVAPNQNRKGTTVSTVVYRTGSKLKALMVFPSIFKGEHIKKEKMVKVFTGKEITVEFDRPTALQIDGETVKNVTTYTVRA